MFQSYFEETAITPQPAQGRVTRQASIDEHRRQMPLAYRGISETGCLDSHVRAATILNSALLHGCDRRAALCPRPCHACTAPRVRVPYLVLQSPLYFKPHPLSPLPISLQITKLSSRLFRAKTLKGLFCTGVMCGLRHAQKFDIHG